MRFVRRARYHADDPARPDEEPRPTAGRHLAEVVRQILGGRAKPAKPADAQRQEFAPAH